MSYTEQLVTSAAPRRGLKEVILTWLGAPIRSLQSVMPSEGSGGGVVTNAEIALRNAAFSACVRLIAQTIGTLPLIYYKRNKSGGREPAYDDNLYGILHDAPNADMTSSQFWEAVVSSILLWGNAFVEVIRGGDGIVIALNFLRPEGMTVKRLDGVTSYSYSWNGSARTIPSGEMMHIPGFTLDGIIGISPISLGRYVLGSAMATDAAARNIFMRGLLMRGTFNADFVVKQDQRDSFKAKLAEYQGVMAAGTAPLLEAGIKFTPITMNPDDAQMLQTRAFNVEEICRLMGVPPFMIGHAAAGDTGWGTGLEQRKLAFLTFGLRFWLVRIEQAIRRSLIPVIRQGKFTAEFSLDGLLRADSAARSAYYLAMVQNGIYTRDEVRALENLAPMGGNADVLTVQNIMIPLDAVQAMAAATPTDNAKSALKSWLGVLERVDG